MNRRKLILPVILAAFVALQCFSSPYVRYSWLRQYVSQADDDDDDDKDEFYDPRLMYPDSVLAKWPSDSLLFYADSLMHVYQIDSASLEPELYLVEVPDSIQAEVDSVFRRLFVQDSIIQAKIAFQQWFDGLSKREQKKWTTENVIIPAQKRRLDSLMHRKDSIKAYKDSVLEATPRVLETNFIPDSLWYKRIVMMTNDKRFGDFKPQKLDTSYNYHFYDYPFFNKDVNATWLGVAGSPAQAYDFTKREEEDNAIFFTPHRLWTYDPSTLPTYNTKTPHTELAFWGTPFSPTDAEEINLRLLTTQNITPRFNATFEINKYGGGSQMQKQRTAAYHMGLGLNYLGKRYAAHGGWIHDKTTAQENGGFVRLSDIRDTTLKSRELEVNLTNANSEVSRDVVFINHSLRIPFGKDSTSNTTAFVGHTTELSIYGRKYDDAISNSYGRAFYNDVFLLNPGKSNDTLGVLRLDNKVYLRMQPWKEDFFISKIDVGIGDKFLRYKDRVRLDDQSTRIQNTFFNNIYAYAGAKGNVKKYFNWNANTQIFFAGKQAGDFNVDADAYFNFYPFRRQRNSPVSIGVHFHTDLTEPDHYEQKILLNHFEWDNSFKKKSLTRISGSLEIPSWNLDLNAGYSILGNALYYDGKGIIAQANHPVNIITASLRKDFAIWKLHFDNRILAQFSSDNSVVPVPLISLNLRWYLQIDAVKDVLQMQIGAQGLYSTKWNMPGYNPELGVFYNQSESQIGGCPYIDVFLNLQWKRACIFVKVENVGNGWPLKSGKDYFTASHYIHTQRGFKMGIFWPFYVRPGKMGHNHDHDHESGSGSRNSSSNRNNNSFNNNNNSMGGGLGNAGRSANRNLISR